MCVPKKIPGQGKWGKSGKWMKGLAHRLAYELLVGPIPEGLFVCHKCDNPPCCNPEHLFTATHAENMADMRKKGRAPKHDNQHGEKGPNHKLTEEQARKIRELYKTGEYTQQGLADFYGVNHTAIGKIVNRQTWIHI